MPDGSAALTLTLHNTIAEVPAAEWDACAGADNPFVSHAFLSALEDSGSADQREGWLAQHAVLRAEDRRVVGVAPMYAKSHSYGEYVFDHGWANALERAGGSYYPKLQVAVPFSPVPGPRLLRRPGAGMPISRPLVRARHLLFGRGMATPGRGRLAPAPGHAVPLGEPRLHNLRRFPRRTLVTQAEGVAARAARRQRRRADIPRAVRRRPDRGALGRVLPLLHLDGGPQMGRRLPD